ncbi:tyrosine-type recombinase/integrase [Bengtsoniella intestinalis]|uniref:tyrosine-type recombinase/integrase n=1 Tax=Bengtsoniella intestinalis TaxID=3073143 RepID=UPI00391FA055
MTTYNLEVLNQYKTHLHEEERSQNTIQKYLRDLRTFLVFTDGQELSKLAVLAFKEHLITAYAPASVNSMLAAVNGFLEWLGFPQYKVKQLKIQREIFSKPEKELSQREYQRLIQAAEKKNNRKLALLIQTICATGIRVSELRHITVSALHTGRTTVSCKGKNRTIFLPKELCRNLKHFCKEQGIQSGTIFLAKTGKPLDRSNIWRMMKNLCKDANVEPSKVFPHNLRHLFARTYYKIEKDISRLADILGHSSINTTRIYTIETGAKHARQIDRMQLVLGYRSVT